jgi:hypothetical protein
MFWEFRLTGFVLNSTASIPAVAGPLTDWPVRFFSSWKLEVL